MSKREVKTDAPKPADAVLTFAHHTPSTVSVGLSASEMGVVRVENNWDYNSAPASVSANSAAEASNGLPIASGIDATPSNWFELAIDLCAAGHISHERCVRAIEAVREGMSRV